MSFRVRIRVRGQLDRAWWSEVFAGLALADEPNGTTVVSGELADQAALHGFLATIRDLGLPLLSVETLADPEPEDSGAADSHLWSSSHSSRE